jgi:hypothetical protein
LSILIAVVLSALAGYFGWLAGRRWERGRIELERNAYLERQTKRGDRPGTIKMTTMQIRR